MYEYIIPRVLKEYDPNTFYWPASPSSGGAFDEPNDENRGDVHYWDVWHGNKPITEYRKFFFRYVSEFGFQSFPSLKTVETFTEPEDRNVFSYVMEKHQRNQSANGKIMILTPLYMHPSFFRRRPSGMAWSISGGTGEDVWEPLSGSSTTAGRWRAGPP